MPGGSLTCIAGDVPLVLVAPHGGRRDPAVDPWHRGGLRTNDLHTADLTVTLARVTGASAIVNDVHDRNTVDLNRVDQTAERLPEFLEAIHDALARAVDRHGRVTLLTVHGWNTTAPVVDVGLGCRPGHELGGERPGAAVSPVFTTHVVPAFAASCARRGLTVSVGRRYPARAPQNLIQLFTGRWLEDDRAPVARVARFTAHCDAMQLELGIPLRWPGPWRQAFLEAMRETTPILLDPTTAPAAPAADRPPIAPAGAVCRLDFVSEAACGLAAIDSRGGRLLLVGLHDGLDLFTHDRVGGGDADTVGALTIRGTSCGVDLAYHGPIGRFGDTGAFLDLEAGLASVRVAASEAALAFRPMHPADGTCPFGDVVGHLRVAGRRSEIDGPAYFTKDDAPIPAAWLALSDGRRIAIFERDPEALLCDGVRHQRVPCALVRSGGRLSITVTGVEQPLRVDGETEHSIPIVRGRTRPASSVALATYRIGGRRAGWGHDVAPAS